MFYKNKYTKQQATMDFDIYKILAGGGFDSPRIVYNKEFMKFAEMMNKLAKAVDIDKMDI